MLLDYIENLIKHRLINRLLADPATILEMSKMTTDCLKKYLIWCYLISDVNNVLSINQENQEIIAQSILEILIK